MAYSGSLFGNYAPAMQEPYAIETALAKGATAGAEEPMSNILMNQYWLERQGRENQYAQRMAGQADFARNQLHAQIMDTYLKTMPELAKNNLLPATASILQSQLPDLDQSGLQYASDQAARASAATNAGNVGRFLSGAGAYGLTIPSADISAATGMPGITPGTPTAVQAQAEANKGRIAAAAMRSAAEKTTNVQTPPMPELSGASVNLPVPRSVVLQGPDAVNKWKAEHGWGTGPQQAPNPNATGAVNTAPPPARTSLPPAPTNEGSSAPKAAPTTQAPKAPPPGTDLTNNPGAKNVVDAINRKIATMPPEQQKTYGKWSLKMGSDGAPHVFSEGGKDMGKVGK